MDFDGTVFGYSGDTAWAPGLIRAAQDADVFACEAYTYDGAVKYHVDYAAIKEHRDELGAGRLLLTHMGPTMLAALEEVEDEAAFDGLVIDA